MKASLSIIKQYINFELPPITELVEKINSQLGGVEEVIDMAAKYKDVTVVKVVECSKHPNADKLNICKVDAGSGDLVQVVCGAPNVKAGMWAAWLPPSSAVPSTFAEDEPFVLGTRELRGVMSNGMLASMKELDLGDDHDGILEIDATQPTASGDEVREGSSFARLYGLDDYVIDIENKMFTHRPDLFGQIGIAREIAGIFGKQFEDENWYWQRRAFENATGLKLQPFNDVPEKVSRIMFVAIKDVTIAPSPLWMKCALASMGSKSISNIVDSTNYLMLVTAQPTHAYDYDKVRGGIIGARLARENEKITLLNGKEYTLSQDDIVIADGEGAIGLAGIMGGGNSEVSSDTKNIILEVGTFDMYTVRKSSMRHGVFTDALTRFNKGQSPLMNDRIMQRLMEDVFSACPESTQASPVFDGIAPSIETPMRNQSMSGTMLVEPDFVNSRLGLSISSKDMEQILRNVRFACYVDPEGNGTEISFTAPPWRTDIEQPEDIVEEVGRLYGFEKLPRVLPARSMKPTLRNERRLLKQKIRLALQRMGANEVLTYSFVHEKLLMQSHQDIGKAYKLGNALSPDLQYYRINLLPSLLQHIHPNIKAGHDEFMLYEIGKGHDKNIDATSSDGVPQEQSYIEGVYASKKVQDGASYYKVRRIVDELFEEFDIPVTYTPLTDFDTNDRAALFAPGRSAVITNSDGQKLGFIGEIKQDIAKSFKLPSYVSAFSIDFDTLFLNTRKMPTSYAPLSKYPATSQDVSLVVEGAAHASEIRVMLDDALPEHPTINIQSELIDVYQAEGSSQKTLTYRLRFQDNERTLTAAVVNEMVDAAAKIVISKLEK